MKTELEKLLERHVFPPWFYGCCTRCGVAEREDGGDNGPCIPKPTFPVSQLIH